MSSGRLNHEVRGYTLLRNVRGKSSAPAHGQGLPSPCTIDIGGASPLTLANPARIGCANAAYRHGRSSASAHGPGLSSPCAIDKGRSCPLTLTNPARIGCAWAGPPLTALRFLPLG
jgi:hypothetical protein